METTAQIKVLEETVFSDGSGSVGLYEVYGQRFSGINNGDGKVTVTPVGIRSGFRGDREKSAVKSASRLIETHVKAL